MVPYDCNGAENFPVPRDLVTVVMPWLEARFGADVGVNKPTVPPVTKSLAGAIVYGT